MEDVYEQSTLADRFDSDEEALDSRKKSRRALAPNVNPLSAARRVTLKRLFIDSRDRNRDTFPNANDFRMSMTVPLKAVRSITLTNAKVPLIGGFDYVAVVLRTLKDRTLNLPKESPGLPGGVLAIFPLIDYRPACGFALYKSSTSQKHGGSQGGWRVAFPQGLPMLSELHFQFYGYQWDPILNVGSYVLLTFANEPVGGGDPAPANNVYMQLEIEHDI